VSSCEVYGVSRRGVVRYVGGARNAFGGAFWVWSNLADYLGYIPPRGPDGREGNERAIALMHAMDGRPDNVFSRTWEHVKPAGRLPMAYRIVLLTTFDGAMVMRDDIPRVCSAMEVVCRRWPSRTLTDEVELLQRVLTDKRRFVGVVWNQTSVNSAWSTESGRPWNIHRDGGAWDIFEDQPDLRLWSLGHEDTLPVEA
jgi:hypothetical protein